MSTTHYLIGFLSGIGLFQLGMHWLEEALQALSSNTFRRTLRITTRHRLTAVMSGIVVTVLVQSSTMVGLMSMALAGAGVIPLFNAVGVMFGANLGTTFTGWMVATLGFKLNLGEYALFIMGGGGMLVVLLQRQERLVAWGRFCIGIGCLLLGLSLMKENMLTIANQFDLAWIRTYPPIVFLLVGVVMSALVQSSSATVMVALATLNSGIIEFGSAASMVIGAEIGTTSTLVLGAMRGSPIKKQLAAGQVIFNVTVGIIAWTLLLPFVGDLMKIAGITDPLYGLVAFHSFCNAVGILLFLPLLTPFTHFLEKHFLSDDEDVRQYINNVPAHMVPASVTAMARETRRLLLQAISLNLRNLKIDPRSLTLPQLAEEQLRNTFSTHMSYNDSYAALKKLEGEILEYAGRMQATSMSKQQVQKIHRLLSSVRHGVYSAKSLKDIRENLAQFRHADVDSLQALYDDLTRQQKAFYARLHALLDHVDDPVFIGEEAERMLRDLEAYYQQIQTELFKQGLRDGLTEIDLSTSLNINRELYGALKNLVESVQDLAGYHVAPRY